MQIAFVPYSGFTALDMIGPYELLRMIPDSEVRFVGEQVGPVFADSGVLTIGVTHTFEETPRPDIVVVPGSSAGTFNAMSDEALLSWLRQAHEHTRWTTSVCTGALVLAAAGLLRGQPATTHWVAQEQLLGFGATPMREERIVRTGKIITAAGVSAGLDMALWLLKETMGQEFAERAQLAIEYDPQPPVDMGHPSKAPAVVRERVRAEMLRDSVNMRELKAVPSVLWNAVLSALRATAHPKRHTLSRRAG